jgi:hypothetical protein
MTTTAPAPRITKTPRVFINRKDANHRETVDEFTTRKEARAMLTEYRMADPTAEHWISNRPCKGWDD